MSDDDNDNQEFGVEQADKFVVEIVVEEDEADNPLTIYRRQPHRHPPPYEVDICLTIYRG